MSHFNQERTSVLLAARVIAAAAVVLAITTPNLHADSFGGGSNQFDIDFVTIHGSHGDGYGGQSAGPGFTTTNIGHSYRIGVYEVTNDQWDKFKSELGVPVTGNPSTAYFKDPSFTGTNLPTNYVSWSEAAQFVNWLNTSTGHQAAYKFNGTQGASNYALDIWSAAEADNGANLFRHRSAKYYLPTEQEWVKAAYWNGAAVQTYATKFPETLHQGDGTSGTGWNYYSGGFATSSKGPWDVGSGSEELNGTYDMMGNVSEWMESSYDATDYQTGSLRGLRGGSLNSGVNFVRSSDRHSWTAFSENTYIGFRVASSFQAPLDPASFLKVKVDYDTPDVVGPISFGLTELPASPSATFTLGEGTPAGGGATGYGLADVTTANMIFGDGVFTTLTAFDMEVAADGSLEALSYAFAPIDTLTAQGPVILNFPLTITGTDIASGQAFSYTYANSTATLTNIPEPATVILLAFGGLMLAANRRKA